MRITYYGPYAELIDGDHEGYAARVMPDGTLTDSWGPGIPDDAHVGFRAACTCGWTGATLHPAGAYDSPGFVAAQDEWDTEHLQPLIDRAANGWRTWAGGVAQRALAVAEQIIADRPGTAARLLDALADDIAVRQRAVALLTDDAGGR